MTEREERIIFSRNLNKYLDISQKNQKEVADAIGVSPQTFNTWCKGIALPRMSKVQRLADYFGISKSDLVEERNKTNDTIFLNKHFQKYQKLSSDDQQTVNNLIDDLSEKQQRLDALIQQLKEEQSSQTLIAADTGKNKVHQEVTDPEKLKHIEELSEKARKNPGAKITD